MGSVSNWLDFFDFRFESIFICQEDKITVFSSRSAAKREFGSANVLGMKSSFPNLYLFLYPIELEDMNVVLEVNYG